MGKSPARCYAWYLVDSGESGISMSWSACESSVRGHHARYRGFQTVEEARAWIEAGAQYGDRKADKAVRQAELPEDAIYFDSGTGRGQGTEVNVTDRDGTPLAFKAAPASTLTEFGTVRLSSGRTNNYGELMGCYLALKVAMQTGSRMIMGDSTLILDYWSRGRVNSETAARDADLALLARRTAELRRVFEAAGGRLAHVPGGVNPADLGFHRD